MAEILFDELKPVLNYFPIKIGKAELKIVNELYMLTHDNLQWMVLNRHKYSEIKDQFIELTLAEGRVVTTGLGLGCRETILSLKDNVKEVIVYEINEDIIKIFDALTKQSNFDTRKIKVVHDDAKNALNIDCDWLILDHFEIVHQTYWEVIDEVRMFSKNCAANNLFFWPFMMLYKTFCAKKQLAVGDTKSYSTFIKQLKVDKMPDSIDSELLQHVLKFDYYK